jgi:hypothetical protein
MIEITLQAEIDGCVHYRVLGIDGEDWSGWADSMDEAVVNALSRLDKIRTIQDEKRCRRCNILRRSK